MFLDQIEQHDTCDLRGTQRPSRHLGGGLAVFNNVNLLAAQLRDDHSHTGTARPDAGTDRGWLVEQDFVASVREGAPVELTSFRDGVRYMRFIEAVWDSWHQGRAIDVPSLEATDQEAARQTLLDEARG